MESNNKGCLKTKGVDGNNTNHNATRQMKKTAMQQYKEWPNNMANNTTTSKPNNNWKKKQGTIELNQNEYESKNKITKMERPNRPPRERDRIMNKFKGCRPTMKGIHHKHTIERVC